MQKRLYTDGESVGDGVIFSKFECEQQCSYVSGGLGGKSFLSCQCLSPPLKDKVNMLFGLFEL